MRFPHRREALDPFVAAANALGGQAAELGAIVQEAWAAQRDFLLMAAAVRAWWHALCLLVVALMPMPVPQRTHR